MGIGWRLRVAPVMVAALLLAGTAAADSVESISFVAPTQSTWGPGGSKAAFNSSGKVGGATHLGYTSKASTGTVRASLAGNLSFDFDAIVNPTDSMRIGMGFTRTGGSFRTDLGAEFDVFANVNVGRWDFKLSAPGFPVGDSLSASKSVTGLGKKATDTDQANFNISAFWFLGVEMGPTFGVSQTASFLAKSIAGTLVYTHRNTGTTRTAAFKVGEGAYDPFVKLDKSGAWDFALANVRLANTFTTRYDAKLGGFIKVPFVDPFEWTPTGFPIMSKSFSLGFNSISKDRAFKIFVDSPEPAPVPEPGSLVLLGCGILAFGIVRARRRR
jgi:hypothetical protein